MDDVYSRAGNAADPPYLSPDYMGTRTRSPKRPLIIIPQTLSEITGPVYGHSDVKPEEADLTIQHAGEPLGERIIVKGRVLDEDGRPVPNTLVEIWQCNAAGRYIHAVDQHPAPLDPNFTGAGRCVTDADGNYQFITIKPGAYPWRNHHNAWRPAHIHFSLFGPVVPDAAGDADVLPRRSAVPVRPDLQLGARRQGARAPDLPASTWRRPSPNGRSATMFDIVLRGRNATPGGSRPCLSARPRRPSAPTCTSASRRRLRRARDLQRDGGRRRHARHPHPHRGPRARRRGQRRARRADRDLAGRPPGPLRPSGRRPAARLQLVPRLRPLRRPTRTAALPSPPSSRAPCPAPAARTQAPHINVGVFARGLLKRLFTRIYFAGEPANAADPILALVPRRPPRHAASPSPTRPSPASAASTSACRAPTRRCSSTREAAAVD